MSFYTISQNNSGGEFKVDENFGQYVIIEAESAEQAASRFWALEPNTEYCECCGERWYVSASMTPDPEPMIYGKPLAECFKGRWRDYVVVHYLDGRREQVNLPEEAV